MILSAVINIIMPTAGCEVTSCFTMEIIQVFQTSDFQQAFRKVIPCNGRYQQGNNKPRCSVFATHVYIWKGRTKFTTSGAHDVIAITSPQKNDLCTEELRDRPKTLEEVSLPLRKARFGCLFV